MRQAKIEYKMTPNGVLFVGFKNVLSMKEIDETLSHRSRKRYFSGRAFYRLHGSDTTVRIFSAQEITYPDNASLHYIDFQVGEYYTGKAWSYFIKFLKSAGESFSKIHREQEKTYVVSI